ncbi:hypothetical protein CHELA40_11455 [Chelatococcus asaccharovorans]|nr:hypothetical protein CHELA40_11455 [Chelatococcus asaccharovorans]CAH1684733.1 hypothetical protein CHELA17_64147 [Chelatococcus asaccharovorans]
MYRPDAPYGGHREGVRSAAQAAGLEQIRLGSNQPMLSKPRICSFILGWSKSAKDGLARGVFPVDIRLATLQNTKIRRSARRA